jgi:hypothetical protein
VSHAACTAWSRRAPYHRPAPLGRGGRPAVPSGHGP